MLFDQRVFEDERLRRVFSFQAMYAGLAPAKALALYAIITYMDSVKGVYFPRGGMHAVPRAMASAAEGAGVEIRYGAEVERVEQQSSGAVKGIRLADGESIAAEAVVVGNTVRMRRERPAWDLRKGAWAP